MHILWQMRLYWLVPAAVVMTLFMIALILNHIANG